MKRTDVLLVICMAAAPGAASALGAQTIVQPAAPLDAGRVRLRDAMVTLRDSLITINGAAARLQRDYRTTSDAALTARAREIVRACARSICRRCGKMKAPAQQVWGAPGLGLGCTFKQIGAYVPIRFR